MNITKTGLLWKLCNSRRRPKGTHWSCFFSTVGNLKDAAILCGRNHTDEKQAIPLIHSEYKYDCKCCHLCFVTPVIGVT
jgi:hypothetical protein